MATPKKKVGYAKYRTTHLQKITDKARKIRRPGEKWTDAVKRASKGAKVGSVSKGYKAVPKKYKVEGELVPKRKGGKPVPKVTRVQLNGVKKKVYKKPTITVKQLSGSALQEISRQLTRINAENVIVERLKGARDAATKKLLKNARNNIAAAKKYITQLKKSI